MFGHQIDVYVEIDTLDGGLHRIAVEAKADVFYYIESFCNRRHRHSALDYLSPEADEQLLLQQDQTLA